MSSSCFASVVVDGTLLNVPAERSATRLALRGGGGGGVAVSVHHVVFVAPFRATLRVARAGFVLTAPGAGVPACGTFALADNDDNDDNNTVCCFVVERCDSGPVSHCERALADVIARTAATNTNHTPSCSSKNTCLTNQRNKAVQAALVVPARGRACTGALANWCPRLAAFRDSDEQQMCVVRRHGPPHARRCNFASSAGSTCSTSAMSVEAFLAVSDEFDNQSEKNKQHNDTTIVRSLFAAAATRSHEWRKCAVSFSTVMRFFQREKATFRWETPLPGAQTVIAVKW